MAAIGKLAARCAGFAEMELDFLYAPMRGLLALGFNVDTQRRDTGCFDLLASEARLGSFVGIALGLLPVEHWFRLNRPLAPGGGRGVLLSWAGTLFEYLMPPLLMPTFPGTLLDATCRGAVQRQMEYGRAHGIPWGVSESCYNEVDAQMTYQYREFGVPGLGLKRGLADDLVVAPYAGTLALMVAPQEACRNLQNLAQLGAVGRFGLYEAMDFTPARLQEGERVAVVRAHMAHHSGMVLLSLVSVLADQPMQRRFLAEPRMRASALLLQERIPLIGAVTTPAEAAGEKTKSRRMPKSAGHPARSFTTAATPVPEVHLLSSGRYHLMVTNSGGGFSRWESLALTRWREDATCDNWGTFFYFCDVDSGRVWSSTWQPMAQGFDRYEVTFAQGMAEFQSLREEIGIRTQIAVSPETDLELRRMTITNHTDRVRTLEVTSYMEPVLLDPATEAEHPCFHGLFGKTEVLPAKAAVLYTRRSRAADERSPWLFHAMLFRGTPIEQDTSCETDRLRFIGRGRTPRFPAAATAPGPLSNTDGYVLDPALAIRRRIRLKPREAAVMDAVFGVAPSREEAMSAMEKCQDRRSVERGIEMARTQSQILLHQLRVEESDAQLFGALAGSVLYASAGRRAGAGQIARNRKGQSALWSYGISGDLPIVLLRVADESGLDLVRHVLQAHAYWRHKGLRVDLVIWAETYTGYRQSLADAIVGLVHTGAEAKALNQPGGVFVRNLDQVPEEDRALFLAVARIVLSDRAGALADQTRRERTRDARTLPPFKVRRGPLPRRPREKEPPARELKHFNGLGGFTPDGREYVVVVKPGVQTPMPWVNVLANPQFGSVVSESGSAYTWRLNAHELRLTPWYNDPVTDMGGEAFYVRDEPSGRFWPLTPGAGAVSGPYVCRHGLGYTTFEHRADGLAAEMTTFVACKRARQVDEHHPEEPRDRRAPSQRHRLLRMGAGRPPAQAGHARRHAPGAADRRDPRLERVRRCEPIVRGLLRMQSPGSKLHCGPHGIHRPQRVAGLAGSLAAGALVQPRRRAHGPVRGDPGVPGHPSRRGAPRVLRAGRGRERGPCARPGPGIRRSGRRRAGARSGLGILEAATRRRLRRDARFVGQFPGEPLAALPDSGRAVLGPQRILSVQRRLRISRPVAGLAGVPLGTAVADAAASPRPLRGASSSRETSSTGGIRPPAAACARASPTTFSGCLTWPAATWRPRRTRRFWTSRFLSWKGGRWRRRRNRTTSSRGKATSARHSMSIACGRSATPCGSVRTVCR